MAIFHISNALQQSQPRTYLNHNQEEYVMILRSLGNRRSLGGLSLNWTENTFANTPTTSIWRCGCHWEADHCFGTKIPLTTIESHTDNSLKKSTIKPSDIAGIKRKSDFFFACHCLELSPSKKVIDLLSTAPAWPPFQKTCFKCRPSSGEKASPIRIHC